VSKSKKGKVGSKRPTALIALIVVLIGTNIATAYYFMFYQPSVPLEDVPMAIEDIMSNPAAYIGKAITITGFYVISAGYPMLVESLMSFMNNSLQPDNYVLITGEPPVSMEQYLGLPCDVKGTGEWADESDGVLGVRYREYVGRQSDSTFAGIYKDAVLDMDYVTEHFPIPFDPDAEKYAVLYSGGIKPEKAYLILYSLCSATRWGQEIRSSSTRRIMEVVVELVFGVQWIQAEH